MRNQIFTSSSITIFSIPLENVRKPVVFWRFQGYRNGILIWNGLINRFYNWTDGDAKSGLTSIKCRDLACDVEPPLLKNCKNLTMKLEGEFLFPISFSVTSFYIYQLHEGLGMRKMLSHSIRMLKNP